MADDFQRLAEILGRLGREARGGLLDEARRLCAAGAQREAEREALLREMTLILSVTAGGRLYEPVLDSLVRLSGAQRGFLLLARPDGTQQIAAARHMDRGRIDEAASEISRRVVGDVMAHGRTVRLDDALNTPPFSLAESVTRLKVLSVLCAPLRFEKRVIGAVYLENRRLSGVFAAEIQRTVEEFAERIGAAVGQAERLEARTAAPAREPGFEEIIGQDTDFLRMLQTVAIAAEGDIPILIEGESGTGKDLVARAVHRRSPRSQQSFVSVNCAALPQALLESELFGHRRGAFTGATHDRPGLFATAHRGTIFLDEIGEMPAELQSKLLRVLQSGEFRPVGSDAVASADVRVVGATRRDLQAEVRAGRFREDLFFRLKGLVVRLPPLRARKEDIPFLLAHFMGACAPVGRKLTLSDDARAVLLAYDYPGNVRELESIIRRATLFARDGIIAMESLPPEVADSSAGILRIALPAPTTAAELLQAKKKASGDAVREVERAFLLQALHAAEGKPTDAARRVGMNRSQFERMLSRHELSSPRKRKGV